MCYKLLNWIDEKKFICDETIILICTYNNKMSIDIINKYYDKLNLSCKIELIDKYYAVNIIKKIINEINIFDNLYLLSKLCNNTNIEIIKIIENNIDKLYDDKNCWFNLCLNQNPYVMNIIKNNLNKLDKKCKLFLCRNKNIIHIFNELILNNFFDDFIKNNHYDYLEFLCNNINIVEIYNKYLILTPNIFINKLDKINWDELYLYNHNNFIDIIKDKINILNIIDNNIELLCEYCSKYYSEYYYDIIIENLDKLNTYCWINLSYNEKYLNLIEKNINKLDETFWNVLFQNPHASNIIKKNLDKINIDNLSYLCLNNNIEIINIISTYIKKTNEYNECWNNLSKNKNAILLLEKNLDKINWNIFCEYNKNAFLILKNQDNKIIEDNLYQICKNICLNNDKNLLNLIKKNLINLKNVDDYEDLYYYCWNELIFNGIIYKINYIKLKFNKIKLNNKIV